MTMAFVPSLLLEPSILFMTSKKGEKGETISVTSRKLEGRDHIDDRL